MASKAPYVSDDYKHLLAYSQGQSNPHPQPHNYYFEMQHINQPPVSQPQPGQYYLNQQPSQQPIVFLPPAQQMPYNQAVSQQKINHDSYAANEPNQIYPSIHSYEKPYFGDQGQPQYQNANTQNSKTTADEEKQIIHKVEYGDTLEGLSLIYDTSISKIKQRNNIEGDSIYYLKEIVIPNPKASPLQSAKTQEMLIEEFMSFMPIDERSDKTAMFYLTDNNWVMEEAVMAFKADLDWERKNKVQLKSVPINKNYTSNDYSERQLLLKKSS